jgi:hypothetical protein
MISLQRKMRTEVGLFVQDFVDLAGSERSSQTSSAGARLKEGSHINRSLLTLGTVIRKLRSYNFRLLTVNSFQFICELAARICS